MPTTAAIGLEDDGPLAPLETERVREILGYAGGGNEYAELLDLVAGLRPEQCQTVRAYIGVWDEIGDDTGRIAGGRDAIDADVERNRELVRRRLRQLFGLPEISGIGTLDRSQMVLGVRLRRKGWSGTRRNGE